MENGINPVERLKHGPVYGGPFSSAGLAFTGLFLCLTALFSSTSYLFLFAPLTLLSFIAFMHYRGVEIDYKKQTIRTYHSYLGLRWGRWKPLGNYEKLVLYFLPTSNQAWRSGSFRSRSFMIELIGKDKKNKIELAEVTGYEGALEFAENYSQKLGKPMINILSVAYKSRDLSY